MDKSSLIVLLGPTASGKSKIALSLIEANPRFRIINCDSKQVYKEIPVITAQPSREEIDRYGHLLYGYINVGQKFDIGDWINDCLNSIEICLINNQIPVLVGGSGFYIKALIEGMDSLPTIDENIKIDLQIKLQNPIERKIVYKDLIEYDKIIAEKIHFNDTYRLFRAACIFKQTGRSIFNLYKNKKSPLKERFSCIRHHIFALIPEKKNLYEQINLRFDDMFENQNLMGEVLKFKELNINCDLPANKAHGLPEMIKYLDGELTLDQAINQAKQNIRNYAKRQETWIKNQTDHLMIISNNNIENILQIFNINND